MPTPTLTLIAAVARNGVIGRDNALPWHLPADLKHFKALTTGHTVIMGRKTWESLPEKFRPLPGRQQHRRHAQRRLRAPRAPRSPTRWRMPWPPQAASEAFVIGGAELYQAALGLADRLELTEIARDYDGDTVFPARDPAQWRETARESQRDDNGLDFAFVSYARS
jgi:dihydrofolate reductase